MPLMTPLSTAAERPTLTMSHWSIWELQLSWLTSRTRHLVGRVVEEGCGKVSSTVVAIDAERRTVTTETGRVYVLQGPPGTDPDAAYTLHGFIRMHGASSETDVTAELVAQLASGG
jgi:hypothetical protein